METPDIGDIVEYGLDSFGKVPQTWRVCSWLRIAPPFKQDPQFTELGNILHEILYEACQEIDGNRMQWCTRGEATHLSLVSVCGTSAPISECKVVGRVNWSEEHITEERQRAQKLGEAHEMIF